jgi:hypothetical protein
MKTESKTVSEHRNEIIVHQGAEHRIQGIYQGKALLTPMHGDPKSILVKPEALMAVLLKAKKQVDRQAAKDAELEPTVIKTYETDEGTLSVVRQAHPHPAEGQFSYHLFTDDGVDVMDVPFATRKFYSKKPTVKMIEDALANYSASHDYAEIAPEPVMVKCKCQTCPKKWTAEKGSESAKVKHCPDCTPWLFRMKLPKHRSIRYKGVHYTEGASGTGVRGSGGELFEIRFKDGTVISTTDLWNNGQIPARFKDKFPMNAVVESKDILTRRNNATE